MPEDYNTPTLPLSALLESLLLVADGPIPVSQFAAALEVNARVVEAALDELAALYANEHRGLSIQRHGDRVQLTTHPAAAAAVEKFLGLESTQRLTRPAVETLSIIAYQQPVTRPQLESIRGVNCDGVIKSLLTKGLIEEMGRTEGPGRPVLYATTPLFLQHFGLSSIKELPPLDIDMLLAVANVGQTESIPDAASTPQPVDVSDPASLEPPNHPATAPRSDSGVGTT